MARTRKTAAARPDPAPAFDAHALIAQVRRDDPAALAQAYRLTFCNEWGRLVLADIAMQAGVGRKYGSAPDLYSVGYHMGGHDLALEILDRSGFDPASAVAMVMTGSLEGSTDERSAQPYPDADAYADPNPDW